MEDSAIVDLYWQRSEQALAETEQKYGAYCHSIAYRICGNKRDAEECVNDTWLGAWNSMPDQRPTHLNTFLGCLTRHLSINRLRAMSTLKRGGRETELALEELSECIADSSDPASEAEARELHRAIRCFVDALSEIDRNIFLGRYVLLLPVADIARRCGCSESRIKSRLFRLRGKLRAALEREGLL